MYVARVPRWLISWFTKGHVTIGILNSYQFFCFIVVFLFPIRRSPIFYMCTRVTILTTICFKPTTYIVSYITVNILFCKIHADHSWCTMCLIYVVWAPSWQDQLQGTTCLGTYYTCSRPLSTNMTCSASHPWSPRHWHLHILPT